MRNLKIHKLIILSALFSALLSCSVEEKIVSTETAYSDGFEVVINRGDNVYEAFHLNEADKIILNDDKASYLLYIHALDHIKNALASKYRQSPNSAYPFVGLDLEQKSESCQEIRLSYHFSKSTYWYKYLAFNRHIIPLSSGYRDLSRDSKVSYSNKGGV